MITTIIHVAKHHKNMDPSRFTTISVEFTGITENDDGNYLALHQMAAHSTFKGLPALPHYVLSPLPGCAGVDHHHERLQYRHRS